MSHVGQQCSICGGAARPAPRQSAPQRLRAWFLHGDRRRGERFECENGHGWTESVLSSAGSRRSRIGRIWAAVAANRTVIPTPQSYAVAALVGLVMGIFWQWLLGWPWWLGPILVTLLAWIAATSTAFRSPQRRGTAAALRNHVDPGGAWERAEARLRHQLVTAPFDPLGLESHSEPARLGGTAGSDDRLTEITVAYGDPSVSGGPLIEVTTHDEDPLEAVIFSEEMQLGHRRAMDSAAGRSDPSGPGELEWTPTEATVRGSGRPARATRLPDHWSIIVEDEPGRIVVVRGHHCDPIDHPVLSPIDASDLPFGPGPGRR